VGALIAARTTIGSAELATEATMPMLVRAGAIPPAGENE